MAEIGESTNPKPVAAKAPYAERPRGLFGRAYWHAVVPFDRFNFGPLARRIVSGA
jgi:hypothetical protein